MFKQYIEKLKKMVGEDATQNILTKSVYLISASTNDFFISYSTVPIRKVEYDVPTYDKMLVKLAVNFVQVMSRLSVFLKNIFLSLIVPNICFRTYLYFS